MKKKIDRFVGINLTEELFEELTKESEELGLTMSAYIRLILLKRKK